VVAHHSGQEGGDAVTVYVEDADGGGKVIANGLHHATCYELQFLTLSTSTRDTNLSLMDQIIANVRYL